MNGGTDLSQLSVQDLFGLLMGKMTGPGAGDKGAQAGMDGGPPKPPGPPTLEEMKAAQNKKAQGMKVGGTDFVKHIMSRTKLPSPDTGVTTR